MSDREHQLDVISRWQPILESAGLWSPTYDALNILILAGVVMADAEVSRLVSQPEFKIVDDPVDAPCAFRTDWSALFKAMGPAGRAELRERIKNKHGCKRNTFHSL
jgi:hypothetical protein